MAKPLNKFTGKSMLAIDAKNRVSVPAAFRDTLTMRFQENSEYLYLAKATWGEGIAVYPVPVYEAMMSDTPLGDVSKKGDKFLMHSEATPCPIDNAGRIRIPEDLMNEVSLPKDKIFFCGHGDFMQIWQPEKYENFRKMQAQIPTPDESGGGAAPTSTP
ncbi:MAG: hypothetical protein NTX50_21860 [Candidatus Sumerlaeota bacterium]|nr:hypothetical protein [Candidatus Sumerlaeota bacterium]